MIIWLTGVRWVRQGGDWDLVFRVAVWGVGFGIVGARLYHDITSWDEVQAIDKWWARNRQGFSDGQRFLLGQPLSEAAAAEVLRTGSQRQRAAAALELKLRRPDQALFEVRAPAIHQRRVLGLK